MIYHKLKWRWILLKEGENIMENISIGQIAGIITLISIFAGAIMGLITFYKSFISKILKPIDQKINHLEKISVAGRNNIELELIKIILVNFINDIEHGVYKSQIQKQNAYELYDRYQTLGGNSYVHDRWKKLKDEGKL